MPVSTWRWRRDSGWLEVPSVALGSSEQEPLHCDKLSWTRGRKEKRRFTTSLKRVTIKSDSIYK